MSSHTFLTASSPAPTPALGWRKFGTAQALRGQSVIAPDGLTLAAVGGLFFVVALMAGMIMFIGARSARGQ